MSNNINITDIAEVILGGTPSTSNPNYWNGNIPWASVIDFKSDRFLYKTEKTITEAGLKNSNTKLLKKKDIIISARGTVGKIVQCAKPVAFNQSCYALRALDPNITNQDYLFYLLKFKVLELKQVAIGGVFDTITMKTFEKMKVHLPSFPIQKKIAAVLSAYDDLIENNNRRIAILEKMAEEIYREWFVRMRFPGHEKVRFHKGVPEGWEIVKVKNIIDRKRFGKIYRENELFHDGEIIVIDQSVKDYLGYYNGKPEHMASIDNPIILFGDHSCKMLLMIESFSLAENVIPFQSKYSIPIIFLFYLVQNLIETTEYKRHWSELVSKSVFLPTLKLQDMFSINVKNLILKKNKIIKIKQNLKRSRDLLLPRLICGKLDVENLDIAFPPGMQCFEPIENRWLQTNLP